jgi:D-glycero-D-manno-heptose 1,7-bisphosphate phosphatase
MSLGAKPMLVLTGKGKATQAKGGLPEGTQVFENLAQAARHIIQNDA